MATEEAMEETRAAPDPVSTVHLSRKLQPAEGAGTDHYKARFSKLRHRTASSSRPGLLSPPSDPAASVQGLRLLRFGSFSSSYG